MFSLKYLIAALVSLPLALVTPSGARAVEDFRVAIKSIVPHLVVVRQRQIEKIEKESDGPVAEPDTEKKNSDSADTAILELLRSRSKSENFQHAFRVTDDLIATIDSSANFAALKTGETEWELLSRDGVWHDISLAAYDKVSRLVILRSSEELLDKIASGSPVEGAVPVGHWIDGILEMGLPTVVVWYEEGAPRAKATMIAATGNAMTRGLAVLDFEFAPPQVGSPVLDADGRLLGLVAMDQSRRNSPELARRFELRESPSQLVRQTGASDPRPALDVDDTKVQTAVIIGSAIREPEDGAELIVPVNILNRLVQDVENSDDLVILDFGLIGVRLGNGDATIRRVISGGAAAENDCQEGDRILSINGQKVRNDGDIFNLVTTYRAGDSLALEIVPANKTENSAAHADATNIEATRKVEITMRGIRTRSNSGSGSKSSRSEESSWLEPHLRQQETRLVGVVREGQAKTTADDDSRLREDIVRLRAEIEALMKELNKHEK